MFRFVLPAGCRVFGVAAGVVLSAVWLQTGIGLQAQTSSSTTPSDASAAPNPVAQPPVVPAPSPVAVSRSRRKNSNRQARIARNIQDAYSHRWEVAGGGGYLRFRTGQSLQKSSEISFMSSAVRQWNPHWGVVADVRGSYGTAKIPNVFSQNNVFRPNISEYNFTGGVQYRYIGTEKYSLSFAGTGGVTLSKFGGDTKGLPSQTLGMWKDSDYNPTFTVSVNFDYNLYNNLAFRVQPTYVGTTFGSTLQNNLGVNGGVVYRFGRQ